MWGEKLNLKNILRYGTWLEIQDDPGLEDEEREGGEEEVEPNSKESSSKISIESQRLHGSSHDRLIIESNGSSILSQVESFRPPIVPDSTVLLNNRENLSNPPNFSKLQPTTVSRILSPPNMNGLDWRLDFLQAGTWNWRILDSKSTKAVLAHFETSYSSYLFYTVQTLLKEEHSIQVFPVTFYQKIFSRHEGQLRV